MIRRKRTIKKIKKIKKVKKGFMQEIKEMTPEERKDFSKTWKAMMSMKFNTY